MALPQKYYQNRQDLLLKQESLSHLKISRSYPHQVETQHQLNI